MPSAYLAQKESVVPDTSPARKTWLNSAEASDYVGRPRRVLTGLAKNGGISFTRPRGTKKLMLHRLSLDAYLMEYGVEPTAEEDLELEKHNRY